jgi:hypothetical protein
MVLAQDARLLDDLLHGAILGTPRMNAFFFRRDVFQTVGGFDASLRMAADRDFMMRLALSGLTGIEIEQVLYCYREHVGSMTFALDYRKIEAIVDEHARWSQKYLQQPGLPAEAGGYLSELRVRDSLWICQESLRQRDLAGALRHAREGVRYSPFWALRFVRDAMLFLARRAAALVHCSQ